MEITQEQAWTIIGAIRTAEMEREDTPMKMNSWQ